MMQRQAKLVQETLAGKVPAKKVAELFFVPRGLLSYLLNDGFPAWKVS